MRDSGEGQPGALDAPGEPLDAPQAPAEIFVDIASIAIRPEWQPRGPNLDGPTIRKYARARAIEVGLAVDAGVVRLWVKDDGVGFDPDNPQLNRHGLAGMKHRVQMFEGRFTVTSAPGAGTRIDATMPLRPAAPSAHG